MPDTSTSPLTKLRQALAQAPYLPRALALVWQAARPWTIAWLALLVIQGLLPIATVYLTRTLVDSLVNALGAGRDWAATQPILIWVGLMALVLLANEILGGLSTWVRAAQGELVSDHIYSLIHEKALSLDLGFFETPAFYDQLHRARVDAINRPVALLENLGGLAQNSITLVAMAAVLLSFGPWIPAVLLVSTLPALFVVARYSLRFHQWRLKNTANERRTRYYDWLLTWHESAAEIRLFSLGNHFKNAFQTLRARLRSERVHLARDQAFGELAAAHPGRRRYPSLGQQQGHRSQSGSDHQGGHARLCHGRRVCLLRRTCQRLPRIPQICRPGRLEAGPVHCHSTRNDGGASG